MTPDGVMSDNQPRQEDEIELGEASKMNEIFRVQARNSACGIQWATVFAGYKERKCLIILINICKWHPIFKLTEELRYN